MPRQIRYNLPDIPQHVIQRGNNRQATFFSDEDYMRYLADLKSACDQHQCEVHAYVLCNLKKLEECRTCDISATKKGSL